MLSLLYHRSHQLAFVRPTVAIHLRMNLNRRRASSISPPPVGTTHETKRRRTTPPESPQQDMEDAPRLNLTEEEESVRRLLVEVAADIDAETPQNMDPLVLRFTGGWVRDKLLGGQSNDIDVGINKMTGFNFATRMSEFLNKEENQKRHNIPPRSIHKIESNPEKSKHLETATTKILGLDIDLVNLRSETYSADSRIPEMEFGTPTQDALRRDACVNALFYNLHTQKVEDFTGRGLVDMRNKLIRTPLAPFETFDDDPLRVLRLIRFSSRLDFEIVPEAKEAMRNPDIKKALRMKISRERVGTELQKMIKGPHPDLALLQIHDLGLFESIFMPALEDPPQLPTEHMAWATTAFTYLRFRSAETSYSNLRTLYESEDDQFIAWLMAALAPWKDRILPGGKPGREIAAAATAAREGFKAENKLFTTIGAAYKNYGAIQKFVNEFWNIPVSRGKAGMFLRNLGKDWRNQYLCALLLEVLPQFQQAKVTPTEEAVRIFEKYSKMLEQIKQMDLLEVCDVRPILDGNELRKALGEKKNGPWMKPALEKLMAYQLESPEKTKADAITWVGEHKQVLLERA